MIAKKNPRYDLERKRIVLFQIGLLTAGSFTLAAFTYKSPVTEDDFKRNVVASSVEFAIEEPREIPKLEIPIVKQEQSDQKSSSQQTININQAASDDIIKIGNDKKLIDPNVGLSNLTIKTDDLINTDIIDVNGEVIDIVEIDAEYIGGFAAMMSFIQSNLNYPKEAIELNEQGKVFVSFIVEKDGSISEINVERGVCKSIDREAARIVRNFPNWKPGEMSYGKVRTRVRLPINFVLN